MISDDSSDRPLKGVSRTKEGLVEVSYVGVSEYYYVCPVCVAMGLDWVSCSGQVDLIDVPWVVRIYFAETWVIEKVRLFLDEEAEK